jgi:hypothetical protein
MSTLATLAIHQKEENKYDEETNERRVCNLSATTTGGEGDSMNVFIHGFVAPGTIHGSLYIPGLPGVRHPVVTLVVVYIEVVLLEVRGSVSSHMCYVYKKIELE